MKHDFSPYRSVAKRLQLMLQMCSKFAVYLKLMYRKVEAASAPDADDDGACGDNADGV